MIQVGIHVQVNKNCDYSNFVGSSGIIVKNDMFADDQSRKYCTDYCNQVEVMSGDYTGHRYWFADDELDAIGEDNPQ